MIFPVEKYISYFYHYCNLVFKDFTWQTLARLYYLNGKTINWPDINLMKGLILKSYLEKHVLIINIDDKFYGAGKLERGVPQGSIICILFSLILFDLLILVIDLFTYLLIYFIIYLSNTTFYCLSFIQWRSPNGAVRLITFNMHLYARATDTTLSTSITKRVIIQRIWKSNITYNL